MSSSTDGSGAMLTTGAAIFDAEQAFTRMLRARRRAALARRLRGRSAADGRLEVYDDHALAGAYSRPGRGVREIPLDAIRGTLEPGRARMFDHRFRPAAAARARWQRLWIAEIRGQVLPPISVVAVDGAYVLRDGHHRVSVARARGAVAIDAAIEAA
jgi:hypothetical protein